MPYLVFYGRSAPVNEKKIRFSQKSDLRDEKAVIGMNLYKIHKII